MPRAEPTILLREIRSLVAARGADRHQLIQPGQAHPAPRVLPSLLATNAVPLTVCALMPAGCSVTL
jgi:hypothetical protein